MQIQDTLQWNEVNWPLVGANAANAEQFAIFRNDATVPEQVVVIVPGNTPQALVTYDDADPNGTVFFIRPTDGLGTYGPAQVIVYSSQPLLHRAWVRSYIRKAVSDRLDNSSQTSVNVSDDELNDYLNDALRQYSQQFPKQGLYTWYPANAVQTLDMSSVVSDFMRVTRVQYTTADSQSMVSFFLKEEPYKGGEASNMNWLGYPKLGILAFTPAVGRLYPGHYEVYEGQLQIDFPPKGDGDYFTIDYQARRSYPSSDLTSLDLPPEDLDGLLYLVQAKVWLEIESRDVNLSRWRTKEDGGRRDDLPTDKMSTRMFNAWQQYVKDRRTLRPRSLRLMRRA